MIFIKKSRLRYNELGICSKGTLGKINKISSNTECVPPKGIKTGMNQLVVCSKGTLGRINKISSNTECVPPKGIKMAIKSWNDYFLDMAKTCSSRSNCLRAQVGAVIVGTDKKIKATGYNGTPSGVESCYERGECYRIKNNIPSGTCYETCRSIHAEQNAIIQAGQDRCMGASMYIYGHNFICILCKRFIVQAGIVDVYLKKDDNSEIVHVSVEDIKRELENTL